MKKNFLVVLIFTAHLFGMEISEQGYWVGNPGREHVTDVLLSMALADFLEGEGAVTTVDFGCGEGDYIRTLQNRGFNAIGYDGNPMTPELTGGLAEVLDLSVPFDLGKTFDWVISLEVGEHLPPQYQTIFIENLIRHAGDGIILSWAIKGQGGTGHFNELDNHVVKALLSSYGFDNDLEAEKILRQKSQLPWFKNTIMVFRRTPFSASCRL